MSDDLALAHYAVNKYTTESEDVLSHENFKEVTEEEFLTHYGIPGMKWGKRKAKTSGGSKTPSRRAQKKADYNKKLLNMSPKQRAQHDIKRTAKAIGIGLGVNVAVRGGITWATNNPDKISGIFDKAKGMANKQQAITKGYTIIKASMGANGTWKV